jgi:hypothetical protein
VIIPAERRWFWKELEVLLDRANEKHMRFVSRADEELFIEFCEDFDYAPVLFEAFKL